MLAPYSVRLADGQVPMSLTGATADFGIGLIAGTVGGAFLSAAAIVLGAGFGLHYLVSGSLRDALGAFHLPGRAP